MKGYKLKSVGVYDGKVCMAALDDKSGKPVSIQELSTCKELVYMRLRTLEAVASFRFLERALGVLSRYDMPVYAMASSAGSFSVVDRGRKWRFGECVQGTFLVCRSRSGA